MIVSFSANYPSILKSWKLFKGWRYSAAAFRFEKGRPKSVGSSQQGARNYFRVVLRRHRDLDADIFGTKHAV